MHERMPVRGDPGRTHSSIPEIYIFVFPVILVPE